MVAVWEVAIFVDIDRLIWKLNGIEDEMLLVILYNDLGMSMYTIQREIRIGIYDMIDGVLFSTRGHVFNYVII